mgnify:FL=1
MHIGQGSPWLGVLVGFPFALLMLWITLCLIARLGRCLAAAAGLAALPADARGASGLLRNLCRDALGIALFGFFTALSVAVVLAGLMNYVPAVGLTHPWVTRIADFMVDAPKTQSEFKRGLKTGNRPLVELALAIGADPTNRGDSTSLLVTTTDPQMRALLIERGAAVDGLPEQNPPLRNAVDNHDLALFEQLLRAGARRGLEPLPGYPRHLLEWMAEAGYGVEWLEVAIATGIDLTGAGYGGASLYDTLSLNAPGGDWWQRLSAAGSRHRLPIDVPQSVPPDHPAVRHVLAWLQSQGTDVEVAGNPEWELPDARPDDSTWIDVPHTDPEVLSVHGGLGDLLIRVRGTGFGSEQATVVVRVRAVAAESGGLPAEADPTSNNVPNWRIAAIWTDARAD